MLFVKYISEPIIEQPTVKAESGGSDALPFILGGTFFLLVFVSVIIMVKIIVVRKCRHSSVAIVDIEDASIPQTTGMQ